MMLLPIVERELRVTARQWRTYWGRTLVGALALVVTLHLIWLTEQFQGSRGAGALLLKMASYMTLAFCMLSAVMRTADCLSAEKREETLGLLFLTHLRAHDIVLGKLCAASLQALLFLVSIVPILAMPIMFGGVTGQELIRVPVSLLNGLFFSLATGLLCSTFFTQQRQAMNAASALLAVVTLGFPVLGMVFRYKLEMPELAVILSFPSPLFAHEMSLTAAAGALSSNMFWSAVGLQSTITLCFIGISCLALPRVWKVQSGQQPGWKERWRLWLLGTPEERRARRGRMLERNPIFWLGARERYAPAIPALFIALKLTLIISLIVRYQLEPALVVFTCALLGSDLFLRGRVAALAVSTFARERQMGTWEMLLSTPLSVKEIIEGNWMAIRFHLLRVYVIFMTVVAGTGWAVVTQYEAGAKSAAVICLLGLISIGEFCVLGYVGMWRGMKARNPVYAAGQALLRVSLMPWFLWAGLMPFLMETPALEAALERSGVWGFLVITAFLWSASTALALRTARRNLLQHFRDPTGAPSLFKTLKRKWTELRRLPAIPEFELVRPLERN